MCAKKATPSSQKNQSSPKKSAPPKTAPSSAKPKAASSETNGVTPASAASKKTVRAKSAVTAALAKPARTLSSYDIGEVAGEIWGLLAANDAETLPAIKKAVAAPADIVAAAIGWLAREDKLEFTASGKTQKLSLKK